MYLLLCKINLDHKSNLKTLGHSINNFSNPVLTFVIAFHKAKKDMEKNVSFII